MRASTMAMRDSTFGRIKPTSEMYAEAHAVYQVACIRFAEAKGRKMRLYAAKLKLSAWVRMQRWS